MESIQSSVNQMLGQAASLSNKSMSKSEVSKQLIESSQVRLNEQKLVRAIQKNNVKARRDEFTASIGGQEIKDPKLLEKIKEVSKNGK